MLGNLANQLTLGRIVVIPIILGLLLIPGSFAAWAALVLFAAAAITDYFDGYFARSRNEISSFGRVLDPIADKLLVAGVILILVFNGRIDGFTIIPACIILLREVAVSGLREFLAELNVGLPVSRLAKWKTGIQMTALPFAIVQPYAASMFHADFFAIILLWAAGVLTVITGWDYWLASLKHFRN